jgi:hypothetical protein
MSSEAAAVPLSGEAFVLVMIVFVAGMLAIVLWRATTKARQARRGAASRPPGSTPGSDHGAS